MTLVATLTLNPGIDVSTSTERVEPLRKLRCGPGRRDPGGGGINVARVARRLGAEAIAVYPAGGFTGQLLQQLVEREEVASIVVPTGGETREDFTVLEAASGQQYRFVLPGPHLHGVEWMACLRALAELPRKPDIVCASGSLPPGAPDDFYARVAEIVCSWGARLALDCAGAPLKAALDERVFLIKPNLRELSELVGRPLPDDAARLDACRELIAGRRLEAVALTLGAEGAMLVTRDLVLRAPGLPIEPITTVGAGDSFLGAMVWALASNLTLAEAFPYAVAAGSAALMADGTELCRAEDVRRLLPRVIVQALAPSPV
ncbi:1-phosphofructokinase family hexose kinase [Phenylobacterium soli]|uniref:Phosphofructokinase n=1 Tax=Phenylobacterium soli TaxID=2170551 RepID=A0A328AHS5_9CAUL|nr:1-phosphofructokinase family hexose kinase [Phenylobacterium soli]RAK54065.1 1-phosphofructokinase family hexose kinase [Phenylobacterium soli]